MGKLRLLCVTAHPDDEAGGFGGVLHLYAARGVETNLICLTPGQAVVKIVHEELIATLRAVREVTKATLVVKRGVLGCSIIEGEIPKSIDEAPTFSGVQVEVLNVLGAGDAFMSGFLSGWLREMDYDQCAARGNGSGALVVARHAVRL